MYANTFEIWIEKNKRLFCYPQYLGSYVLDPVLFLLYTSDLVELVRSFGLLAHASADDLQVYCQMNVGSEQVMLQRFSESARDLGVMLDSKTTMPQYILRVCQNCYFQLRLIRRLGKALSVESKLLLVHALVHSPLEYCNSVLTRLPWSLVQQLQCMLSSLLVWFLAWSALMKHFDHITPALIDLHWFPYPQCITYKL